MACAVTTDSEFCFLSEEHENTQLHRLPGQAFQGHSKQEVVEMLLKGTKVYQVEEWLGEKTRIV